MAESCVELDQTAKRFKLASPLAVMELCSQVPTAPRHQRPLVTTLELPHARSPAATPVPSHHLGVSETGARQGAALHQHHERSQEGSPDLLHSPRAWELLAGPGGISKTGITPKHWQKRVKARTVFPCYCTLCSHWIFLVFSFLFQLGDERQRYSL